MEDLKPDFFQVTHSTSDIPVTSLRQPWLAGHADTKGAWSGPRVKAEQSLFPCASHIHVVRGPRTMPGEKGVYAGLPSVIWPV